jgi:heme-degrading monooxygenase HmoA
MIIKVIDCHVPTDKRGRFSHAQEQWKSLKTIDGFYGQIGGWDIYNSNRAIIIAFWRDHDSYKAFMENDHDLITTQNQQDKTYNSISVKLFDKLLDIQHQDIKQVLKNGNVLRMAECFVQPSREEHFVRMQKEVWNPKMAESTGMLGGIFAKGGSELYQYLVVTLWDELSSHHTYKTNDVPWLIEKSQVKKDTREIYGGLVLLEMKWKVDTSPFKGETNI